MNGMKEGAGDDPYADEGDEMDGGATATAEAGADVDEPAEQVQQLPYIHRRGNVKEGRSQRPVWYREETEERIEARVEELEARIGESIMLTDYLEAIAVADTEETDAETVLRRWGYGMR